MVRLPTLVVCLLGITAAVRGADDLPTVVGKLDRLLVEHWRSKGVTPAAPATYPQLARRLSLDLLGRVPTDRERESWLAGKDGGESSGKSGKVNPVADAHAAHVEHLLRSAEFPLYFGTVLDEMLQGRMAGNESFVDYLRQSLATGKSWERVFREVIAGAAEGESAKQAALFVDKRAKDIDQLTVDTARGFFGVDISCARCHDHPLVADWTQFHYYGLAAFLRAPSGGKSKGDGAADNELKFLARNGQEQTARMMFLSGQPFEPWLEQRKADLPSSADEATRWSPRRRLVEMAVDDRQFLSRALANRLWEQLMGRGLVEPVDQLHSNNPASVSGVLELLAADLAEHGYDPRRTIRVITLCRAYRASSETNAASETNTATAPGDFAAMRLKPLSPRQFAVSLTIAAGDQAFDEPTPNERRLGRILQVEGWKQAERLLELEASISPLMPRFDPRTADFQSSAREALFVSNSEAIQRLVSADGKNLAARMAPLSDDAAAVKMAFESLFQRSPTDSERDLFAKHMQGVDATARPLRCADIVWALATSAEFRFNH